MSINAKACIHIFQKQREITPWTDGISLAFTLSVGPEISVETERLLHKKIFLRFYNVFFYWILKTSKDRKGSVSLDILFHCLIVIMGKKNVSNPKLSSFSPLSDPFPPGTARVLSGVLKLSLLQTERAPPCRMVLQSHQCSGLLQSLWFNIVSPLWCPRQDSLDEASWALSWEDHPSPSYKPRRPVKLIH